MTKIVTLAFLFCVQGFLTLAAAEEVLVAVAANFRATLHEIASNFEQNTEHTTIISSGSSGKLYAQMKHGAPFDVFFSADVKRPKLLEEEGVAVLGSRFTYAVGRLTLWSPNPNMVKEGGRTMLLTKRFAHLAMANPKTAPYGMAAQDTLKALGLWKDMKNRIVQGENIGQTFHFVFSQNAQLGFVALSQVLNPKLRGIGSRWDVPTDLYHPLRQQAVLLVKGRTNQAAIDFLQYVKGPKARNIIEQFGYGYE